MGSLVENSLFFLEQEDPKQRSPKPRYVE